MTAHCRDRVAGLLAASSVLVGLGACRPVGSGAPVAQSRLAPVVLVTESHRPVASRQHAQMPLFLAGSQIQELVSYDVVDGMAIMEGDILLGPASTLPYRFALPWAPTTTVKSAVALANRSHLWPRSEMPYVIDRSVKPESVGFIQWAVGHMSTTPLMVRPRRPADADYVVFRDSGEGSGCSAYLGRIGGPQEIEVADCGRGSVVHEILHSAGFYHEQSRGDRDGFVVIEWDEITPDFRDQFEKRDGRGQDIGGYDYDSIMHYSSRAFSRRGRPTIVPKVPNAMIGQREGLSSGDRAALDALYGRGTTPFPPQPQPPGPRPAPSPVPGPTPPAPVPPPTGFGGTYSSARGMVTCSPNGSTITCQFPGGGMLCSAVATRMDCGWSGGGQGRAAFVRQPNGVLAGTWGDWLSTNSRGSWDLVPTSGALPPAPGPAPAPPAPAPAATQGAAPLSGSFTSTRGPMTCIENGSTVACTFQERGAPGRVDCSKDASNLILSCSWGTFFPLGTGRASFRRASAGERRLTGAWGYLASDSGGGAWEMVGQ